MNLNVMLPSKPEEWCWQDNTSPAALQVSSNYTWQNKFYFNMLIFEKDTVTVIAKWIFNCVLLWKLTFQACCLQRQRQPSCPKTREKRGARQTNEGFLLGQGTTVGWWTENYWGNKIAEKKIAGVPLREINVMEKLWGGSNYRSTEGGQGWCSAWEVLETKCMTCPWELAQGKSGKVKLNYKLS